MKYWRKRQILDLYRSIYPHGDWTPPSHHTSNMQYIPTLSSPHLKLNCRVDHRVKPVTYRLGITTLRQPNVILEQDMCQGKLQLIAGEKSPRTYVPSTAENVEIGTGLNKLARLVTSITLAQESMSIVLVGTGVYRRVPQAGRIYHDVRATGYHSAIREWGIHESCTLENH
jgi:hypothetical protein